MKPTLPVALSHVPPEARFAYGAYLSERRTLLRQAEKVWRDKDKFASAMGQVQKLDESIKQPPMTMPEDRITSRPIGSSFAAAQACMVAADTRRSRLRSQTYGNCGLEAWRIFINQQRKKAGQPAVSEEHFLQLAIKEGWAVDSKDPTLRGGSGAQGQVAALARFGIASSVMVQSPPLVIETVMRGRPLSVGVEPSKIWPTRYGPGVHALVVTGLSYDKEGEVSGYTVNDTGLGACGIFVPRQALEAAMIKDGHAVVVTNTAW